MVQPFDCLSEQDKYNIRKYIYLYANCDCGSLDIVLREWNKSKRRLFHAFGNNLTIKKTITLPKKEAMMVEQISEIYNYKSIFTTSDILDFILLHFKEDFKDFYTDFLVFVFQKDDITTCEKKQIARLFRYSYVINGYITMKGFKLQNYSFSIHGKCKTMSTIQKCIKALGYSKLELFESWKNQINTLLSNRLLKANLVLSINPIDFITMSDNSCNWSSCMSWINKGCYNAGTIEMMNSNLAVVAYLEPEKKFSISLDEDNQLIIPNKSWRCLVFCHKDIILIGKSYPYYNEDLSKAVLAFMRETVKKSFNWTYQFEEQEYKDLIHYYKNAFLKELCIPNIKGKKKIIIYTKGMYNDFIEDTDSSYWCCRNVVKNGLRLCLSGKHTCMCCGDVINSSGERYNCSPDDIETNKICGHCRRTNKCPVCGIISWNSGFNKFKVCSKECAENALYFPGQKIVINKTEFLSCIDLHFFFFVRNHEISMKMRKIIENIENYYSEKIFNLRKSFLKNIFSDNGLIYGRDYLIKEIPDILCKKGIIIPPSFSTKILFGKPYRFSFFEYIKAYYYESIYFYTEDISKGYIIDSDTVKQLKITENIDYCSLGGEDECTA